MTTSSKSLKLKIWDKFWFSNKKSNDLGILNSAFKNRSKLTSSIFSFRLNNSDDEHDAIETQLKDAKGKLRQTVLFGDATNISPGRDLCDDMAVRGRVTVAVVAETSFDLDALHKKGLIDATTLKELATAYSKFLIQESWVGDHNGVPSAPANQKNNQVQTQVWRNLDPQACGNPGDFRVGNDYLNAWNQNIHDRTDAASAYQTAVKDVFDPTGYEFDFTRATVNKNKSDTTHLKIDTVNFASGLIELAAVENKVGAVMHHSANNAGLTHDNIIALAGFHDWRDLREKNSNDFDDYFGDAETKDTNGKVVSLDVGLVEVLNHGVIETAQKILAIDEMVFAYDHKYSDSLESIFNVLTAYTDKLSAEQRFSSILPSSFAAFEAAGTITAASIEHVLSTGYARGNNGNNNTGVGLDQLAQLTIAHFM